MATIERAVWETRKRTEEKIFKLISSSLKELQIAKLDRVLTTIPERSKTYLAWLREDGEDDPEKLANFARRTMKKKKEELELAL
ncbi:hypothetical protein NV381_05165 [Paenibacillus sp. N5-1-1-5]|uniref:Uncharacterized protein n=1 Tax=Paenibacillus radicis (ex Xue et al. 2023) TaxID=2972489 RepID=A0ABT1YBL9_9BACL|nr:hypothetical protein [Paenibacillus radicis (ex Xue et al. 2023)]MCR8630588.1 hypothetical protein [Paenibacillus radicis (ex Xue et al. 2023)]